MTPDLNPPLSTEKLQDIAAWLDTMAAACPSPANLFAGAAQAIRAHLGDQNRPDSSRIQPRFKASIDAWTRYGVPPGDFLQAVLRNDLTETFARADFQALPNIPHVLSYVYNECDHRSWGSPEKVLSWAAQFRQEETPHG